jgi:hypothetical protein
MDIATAYMIKATVVDNAENRNKYTVRTAAEENVIKAIVEDNAENRNEYTGQQLKKM